ncbi:hypothetical protein AC1031_011476 [Aphanomyces cochlioides]|nr:hypothetical protein AC1031_011476 [Aphanomyces cochlioides]
MVESKSGNNYDRNDAETKPPKKAKVMQSIFMVVLCNNSIFRKVQSYMHGTALKEYTCGNLAAKRGFFDVIRHAPHIRFEDTKFKSWGRRPRAMDFAARQGLEDIVLLLHNRPDHATTCTSSAMDWAAATGNLKLVQWLHAHRSEGCTQSGLDEAAYNGHLDVIEWLVTSRDEISLSASAFANAAQSGHLHVLQWFVSRGFPLEIAVEWLHRQNCLASTYAMDCSAEYGNLAMIQWHHTHRDEGATEQAIDAAANCGHLDVVQWLSLNRNDGCTTEAVDSAAGNGHLDVLKWLLENRNEGGTTYAMDRAAEMGHLEAVQWLHAHRSEGLPRMQLTWQLQMAIFMSSSGF